MDLAQKMESPTDADLSSSKRWHVSASNVSTKSAGITIGIASEHSWFHGYARWSIHIGAKHNQLTDGFSWWTVGSATEVPGQHDFAVAKRYVAHTDTASSFTNEVPSWLASFGYALLRDVREPAERILGWNRSRREWDRILTLRKMLLHRAAAFYGTNSSQYFALYAQAGNGLAFQKVGEDMPVQDVLPKWSHIQSRMAMAGNPYEDQVIWRSVFGSALEE